MDVNRSPIGLHGGVADESAGQVRQHGARRLESHRRHDTSERHDPPQRHELGRHDELGQHDPLQRHDELPRHDPHRWHEPRGRHETQIRHEPQGRHETQWWHDYADLVPAWLQTYLQLERSASAIDTFQVQFVPGLLQSADYARSVIVAGHQGEPVADIDRRVELRMTRQQLLGCPDGPQLRAVIDEAALRRPFGSPRVMRGQLDHLLQMSELPTVTVQVLPFRFGGHAAAGGPFTLLRFADPAQPDVAYLEQLTTAVYLADAVDVAGYAEVMDRVAMQAETPARSAEMLHRMRRDV